MISITRVTHHAETRCYVENRWAEGKTDREIRRGLKRYLARRVFRVLAGSVSSETTGNTDLQA